MKILVLNCGSSSLKYQLIDMTTEEVVAKGNYERIGVGESFLTHTANGEKTKFVNPVINHDEAISFVLEQLTSEKYGVIKDVKEITGVGHRIVHGGEKFTKSVLVDDSVIEGIRDCIPLAPLHNPAAILGIEACRNLMPNAKMVTVFDTSFHQTMPEKAYIFPIPYEYYEKYAVRRYGAHGTSHKYVALRVAELEGRPVEDLKIITCHLGQGASLAAVKNGKCVDTSMGLTPLGGIPMGSRSGDLDPSIVSFIMNKEGMTADEVNTMLNKKSGVFGISGVSADFRDIEEAANEENHRAKLALEQYSYAVAQYIAKFTVATEGVDVMVFTAGVGENAPETRAAICKNLKYMGIELDEELNDFKACKVDNGERLISTANSKVKVYVIPTNEELMIARETKSIIE